MTKRVLICGGGTGGHVFPALAIAETLRKRVSDIQLHFVGAKGRMEMERVPKAGFTIDGLWITGIDRKLTLRNFLFPLKLISSLIRSWIIIRKFRPHVVVGVGGFASGPVMEVALRMGIPCIIQEQNSFPGITNRLLGKRVAAICGAYETLSGFFQKEKIHLTGNPVRSDLKPGLHSELTARKHYNLNPNMPVVLILGGSLGARSVNRAVAASFEQIKTNSQVQWIWQTGKLYYEEYKNNPVAQLEHVITLAFIDRMDMAYESANLVISRAGALSISELCIVGKPTILIPSPNVSEDHQTKNAMALSEKGAAIIIRDADAEEKMVATALDLLTDENRKYSMTNSIRAMAKPNAANEIVDIILKNIRA